jgi:outer membrane receptor protein involved in Fe transport
MQLKKLYTLSKVTAFALISSHTLVAENYVSVEYLQYDENNDRVSVSAPMLSVSYDINKDYNVKADFVHDAVSGATPIWQVDGKSGASSRDNSGDYVYKNADFDEGRNAGSLTLTSRLENRDEIYTGIDYSRESDFDSKAVSFEYLHYTDNSHNQSINFGLSYAYNEILAYNHDTGSGASEKETSTSINVIAGLSQILSTTSAIKAEAFAIIDTGYLTNPHSNIVRNYGTTSQSILTEVRPDSRTAYGFSLKYNTLLTDKLSYKANYRFYTDDWEINSHTLDNDIYYEVNNKLTLGAGLRYYTQSKASFYNANKNHFTTQAYASSDERLSNFHAFTYKASLDYKVNDEVSYNIGAQFYTQSTGLDASIFTAGIKYRF